MEKQIHVDLKTLSKENEALAKELNELAFKNTMTIRAIERIPQNLVKEPKGLSKEEMLHQDYEEVCFDNERLRMKLDELTDIKDRMSNIIEICEINSHQNEKWIIVAAAYRRASTSSSPTSTK